MEIFLIIKCDSQLLIESQIYVMTCYAPLQVLLASPISFQYRHGCQLHEVLTSMS